MSKAKVLLVVEDDKKRAEICGFLSRKGIDVDARKTLPASPDAAEMAKLLENIFRAVNIGLVNEVAIMCDKLGIDVLIPIGGDDTLFAKIDGIVHYKKYSKSRKVVSVLPAKA